MAVIPLEIIDNYSKTLQEIRLINGSTLKGIPASEPSRFRGPQFHGGWCDELAAWDYLDEAWDIMQLGLRLGSHPVLACTTTPRPKPLISDLVARNKQDVAYVSASTYANIDNLAPTFRKQILQYEGTTFGRQEIYAEIIDPEESGIVKRKWFEMWSADKEIPAFEYIVQSYDCATSDKTQNDPTACTVWGVFKPSREAPMSIMLIDCWSEHIQYPELRSRVIKDGASKYGGENEFGSSKKVDMILVEDKSAGISLIQDLRRAGLPVRAYNPGNADKLQRLNIVAPIIQKGLVHIPESAKKRGTFRQWAEVFMAEVCAFPSGRHDDIVDSTSQALRLLRDLGFVSLDNIQPLFEDTYRAPQSRQNPYAA
jgi:predicted phage terminase large subunit-like protein